MEKEIKSVERRAGDLRLDFGNPRKIKNQRKKDLEASLERYGDFDIIVINEDNQVIGGNQRVTIFQAQNPDMIVTCKMLIGYSIKEQKAINVKLNTHAGDWDLDLLNDWGVDNLLDDSIREEVKKKAVEERAIKEMELIHYEHYDYVMIVCRNELDYNELVRKLGIDGAKVKISKRKINGRAIWYDQMKAQIISAEQANSDENQDEQANSGESQKEEDE